jgi:hypothetical protein
MSDGKAPQGPDLDERLKGTTLKVHRYIYKAGGPVRVNEVQRSLKMRFP